MLNRIKAFVLLAWDGLRKKSFRLSLRLRLFAFLALFAAAIILALFVILSASGVLSAGMNESRLLLQNELTHISENAADAYGALTAEGLALSGRFTGRIEETLREKGVAPSELENHSEVITDVLRSCFDPAASALSNNRASGAFIVLDATVSPGTGSRAGIFIRNMEPNSITHSNPSLYFMRGPIVLARESGMNVLPQWLMEFPVTEGDFFHKAMEGADAALPLARTYYWNPRAMLAGDYDDAMTLCVPMVSSDGTVLGICGFEVGDLLFKMQYLPDTSVFSGLHTVFAPVTESGAMDAEGALFSGSTAMKLTGELTESAYTHGLSLFEANGTRFVGLSAPVRLYSKNAVHDRQWMLAVLMSEEELADYTAESSRGVTALLVVLLLCAVGLAVFLSHRYLVPVLKGLEQIRRRGAAGFVRTNVQEIDDLMDFLAEEDEKQEAARRDMEEKLAKLGAEAQARDIVPPPREDYEAFCRNLQTLTPSERRVFDLYRAGHRGKDIPDIMGCSTNNIKFHNKNIYGKLWVSSRKELLGYIKMMDEEEKRQG
jgi:DNA-binding CsgD family transcriptional regulator